MSATLFAVLTLLVACASGGASPANTSPTPDTGEPTIDPSEALRSLRPSPANGVGDEALTGRLGFDDIEGGCAYLETDDGTRYEVVYPDGWQLERSPLQLTSPDGEAVARGGDEVTVRGMVTEDMASICQIGPIFEASAVEE